MIKSCSGKVGNRQKAILFGGLRREKHFTVTCQEVMKIKVAGNVSNVQQSTKKQKAFQMKFQCKLYSYRDLNIYILPLDIPNNM